ncbi:MAG TPA: NEW3 domain-containing protein [Hyphomicrobiales bacterium]|nr:NEW3 domain-containing protein [Hyphomicrobiales bacterium]
MRAPLFALAFAACLVIPAAHSQTSSPSDATAAQPAIHGLWLTTPYPQQTVHAGDEISLDLSLTNSHLAPQRAALSVTQAPPGWKAEIDGGGKPVAAAFAPTDGKADLKLKLTPPDNVKPGPYQFVVEAKGPDASSSLPLTLTLSNGNAAKLSVESDLPALKGSSTSSFAYTVTIRNEGGEDAVVSLGADVPKGFQPTITEAYGTQELTSIPIKAGQSKDIKLTVKPPDGVAAGTYPVVFHAATAKAEGAAKLSMAITGQPQLALTGPGGRLSGDATAGAASTVQFTLRNNGTAPAQHVELAGDAPSGWTVAFAPKSIDTLGPNAERHVAATITPVGQAIAGDYMVTMRATPGSGGGDASADYRVTVHTSTLWGIVGIIIIAAALIALSLAVVRYGRR